jgi:hypothetical protein
MILRAKNVTSRYAIGYPFVPFLAFWFFWLVERALRGSKAVVLQFENVVRMIEGLCEKPEPHRMNAG